MRPQELEVTGALATLVKTLQLPSRLTSAPAGGPPGAEEQRQQRHVCPQPLHVAIPLKTAGSPAEDVLQLTHATCRAEC